MAMNDEASSGLLLNCINTTTRLGQLCKLKQLLNKQESSSNIFINLFRIYLKVLVIMFTVLAKIFKYLSKVNRNSKRQERLAKRKLSLQAVDLQEAASQETVEVKRREPSGQLSVTKLSGLQRSDLTSTLNEKSMYGYLPPRSRTISASSVTASMHFLNSSSSAAMHWSPAQLISEQMNDHVLNASSFISHAFASIISDAEEGCCVLHPTALPTNPSISDLSTISETDQRDAQRDLNHTYHLNQEEEIVVSSSTPADASQSAPPNKKKSQRSSAKKLVSLLAKSFVKVKKNRHVVGQEAIQSSSSTKPSSSSPIATDIAHPASQSFENIRSDIKDPRSASRSHLLAFVQSRLCRKVSVPSPLRLRTASVVRVLSAPSACAVLC